MQIIFLAFISIFCWTALSPVVFAQSAQPTKCQEAIRGTTASSLTSLENLIKRVSENKKVPLKLSSCGENCFQINSSLTDQPRIIQVDSDIHFPFQEGHILTTPPLDSIADSLVLDNMIRRLLIGHELHPYISSPSQANTLRPSQQMAIKDFKESLDLGYDSFLHISTTGTGKGAVLAKNLIQKLRRKSAKQISFITVDKIKIVEQLASEIQSDAQEADFDLRQLHWIAGEGKDFTEEIRQALSSESPTVINITINSFRIQLEKLKNKNPSLYEQLLQNLDGIYFDEVHHLGAPKTLQFILDLREKSKVFLYGATATPVHKDIIIQELFQKVHWSYLEEEEFDIYPPSMVIDQLGLSIERGDITPFNDIYTILAEDIENMARTPFFVQSEESLRFSINPHYYGQLREMLSSIFESNKKGMVIASTIKEAEDLADFFNETTGITFETYHSEMKPELKEAVFKNSREQETHYIVAVRALDEGVNLPHLSAYIDLNSHVSIKQMVHRIGRVLRPALGKLTADIFILSSLENFETTKELMNNVELIQIITRDSIGLKRSDPTSPARKKLRNLTDRSYKFLRRQEKFWSRKIQKKEGTNTENENSTNDYYNYLAEMRKLYPLLSPEKQHILFKEFKKTGEVKIRNELVSRNLGLVAKVANRYKWALPPTFDMMDLIQEGNEGLIEAVEKYKPELGYPFSTFAFYYIRNHISQFCVEQGHLVKVPNHHSKVVLNLERQKELLFSQGKNFNAELVAENLSTDKNTVSPETVKWMNKHLSQEIISFSQAFREESDPEGNSNTERINSFEEVYDRDSAPLEDVVAAEQILENFKGGINNFLLTLNPREKDIFIKRFLMYPQVTLKELAKTYNVSIEQIRRNANKLWRKIRHPSRFPYSDLSWELTDNFFSGSSGYPAIYLLNSYTESIYGMSFLEYIQADHTETHYHIPSSLPAFDWD